MELITFESETFKEFIKKLDALERLISSKISKGPMEETWLDIQETCLLLKISKRTLQSYRDNGILAYSQIAGKIYYKASDIEKHLNAHYIKSSNCKK
ncbi:helix-turn-helix domain-containing protein [Candidatus Nomurabacteria bacterium]|nr:helix-turn-helix domain-containing protein [Candidatus Nomurabacteria bacterium]